MKKIRLYKNLTAAVLLGTILSIGFFSCDEYPNAYKHTDGVPEVLYVRSTDPTLADSLMDGAYLDNLICLVGNNLRSIHQLYFNDQPAILNSSYITDHTLLVYVPKGIPSVVTNKIYMIAFNGDTASYDFKTIVPPPAVNSMKCEYAPEGTEGVLYGNYFLDDPNIPLTIEMAGNLPVTDIISIDTTEIHFIIPQGAIKGYINVTSLYGTSRSKFQYKDDRGMILDWDNLNANGGWRSGVLASDGGISGNYVVFKGNLTANPTDWPDEDHLSFNLWGVANGRPQGDFFDASSTSIPNLLLKFEVNVVAPWSNDALQIVFTSWDTQGTNGYYSDETYSRGLWMPWSTTGSGGTPGSYQTDGWTTVTIPMSNFKFSPSGAVLAVNGPGFWGGLSMMLYKGGVNGTACSPEMWIDNIRVVPVDK